MLAAWSRVLVLLPLFVLVAYAEAATQAQVDTAASRAAAWLISNQRGDGNWDDATGVGVQMTAQAATGLSSVGVKGYPIRAAGAWLSNATPVSVDGLARQIRSRLVPFANTNAQQTQLRAWRTRTDRALWGSYPNFGVNHVDTGLGILATLETTYTDRDVHIATALTCDVFPDQTAGGGWPLVARHKSTVAPAPARPNSVGATAVVLRVVSELMTRYGWTSIGACPGATSSYTLSAVADSARDWLLGARHSDGGLGDDGTSSVLPTASAYNAVRTYSPTHSDLPALLDYLLTKQDVDGSWGKDPMQTGAVLEALGMTASLGPDSDGDGLPDSVELLMGSNPAVADSRSLADSGNGNAVVGGSTPLPLSTSVLVNQSFSLSLQPFPGVAPFIWKVTGGILPPGVSLTPSGVISGTPTQIGSYAFNFKTTDSAATPRSEHRLGLIEVHRGAPSNGDVNADGEVDLADYILMQRMVLKKLSGTPAQNAAADIAPQFEPDGVVDAADLAALARKLLLLD